MADPDTSELDERLTAELARTEPPAAAQVPVAPARLRDQLPGLEPERHLTDWGRSQRVEGLVDRTVYDFLYRYWFRVEVEGIENVPAQSGALLLANHAGAVPPDGAMIAKAIREEHPASRPLHLMIDSRFTAAPGLGMLLTKIGSVPAHPANLHRLLFDERELVLAFPEGRSAARKPLKERYRLRRFGIGWFVESALRARVPIVPVAVLGAEEAMPVLARIRLLRRLPRLPALPITPAVPLPAKFRIRFLEPVHTDQLGEAPWEDRGFVQALVQDIRALIQENLFELVAARRSIWLG
jgi:1-acyl-sn-glycerol-3-phosphate acyltransferase